MIFALTILTFDSASASLDIKIECIPACTKDFKRTLAGTKWTVCTTVIAYQYVFAPICLVITVSTIFAKNQILTFFIGMKILSHSRASQIWHIL